MKKNEQFFCTALQKWWVYIGSKIFKPKSMVIEAKVSREISFNYKTGMKEHQIPTLMQYKAKPMSWKISDMDTISTKHFDSLHTNPQTIIPCIAITWVRRGNKIFYLIDPEVIKNHIDGGNKSLKETEAMRLCFHSDKII